MLGSFTVSLRGKPSNESEFRAELFHWEGTGDSIEDGGERATKHNPEPEQTESEEQQGQNGVAEEEGADHFNMTDAVGYKLASCVMCLLYGYLGSGSRWSSWSESHA